MLGHSVPLMVVHGFLGHSSTAITGAVHGTSRPPSPAAPWTSWVPPSVSRGRPMVVKTAHQLESRPRVADVPRSLEPAVQDRLRRRPAPTDTTEETP
jgi:hypothetical protein